MTSSKKQTVDKSRRRFLWLGAVAGAGVGLGGYIITAGERVASLQEVWRRPGKGFSPSIWLHIGADGTITVRVNHTEMGQGIATAMPMVLADELGADWRKVGFEIAEAESVYKNPAYGAQMTAGSTSMRWAYDVMRTAGAAAREMLVKAAAAKWGVGASQCRADMGRVVHKASGRSASFGQLAGEVSKQIAPQSPALKKPDEFKLIGKDLSRLDSQAKATGQTVYGMDIQLPGLLFATVLHPPALGDKLGSYDSKLAGKVPGVIRVAAISNGLAVVANDSWAALQGAQKLKVRWDANSALRVNSQALAKRWATLAQQPGDALHEQGDVEAAIKGAAKVHEAAYHLPYQAHATPEPMNCTARLQSGICEVWAPTQNQDSAQETAARISGLPYGKVRVHTPLVGGGFGRRVGVEYVAEAVELAMLMKRPVKVFWTREEDTKHDLYRPAGYNLLRAGLDGKGMPLTWSHRIVGPDHMSQMLPKMLPGMMPYWIPRTLRNAASWLGGMALPSLMAGKKAGEGAAPLPYAIDNQLVDYVHDDPGVPVGFWRSVAFSSNVFVVESFIDELACLAEQDPLAYRLALCREHPRLGRVMEVAASRAGWSDKTGGKASRGIAAYDFHGTAVAAVAEVNTSQKGRISIERMVCAVDCGVPVNPRIIRRQIRGGMVFGLTAAFKSAVSLKNGEVEQSNFHDFELLRMDETPPIEVKVIKSSAPPTGVGEASVPLAAPALANAIFAATGQRRRSLPLSL